VGGAVDLAAVDGADEIGVSKLAGRVGGEEVGPGALRILGGDGPAGVGLVQIAAAGNVLVVFGECAQGELGVDGGAGLAGGEWGAVGPSSALGDAAELIAGAVALAGGAVGAINGVTVEGVADERGVAVRGGEESVEQGGAREIRGGEGIAMPKVLIAVGGRADEVVQGHPGDECADDAEGDGRGCER